MREGLARHCGILSLLICCLWVSIAVVDAESPRQKTQIDIDTASLDRSAVVLYKQTEAAVASAGGDLSKQHIHLVLAFSTGHFANDPIAADAARHIASSVSSRLVEDDRLSVYAWELGLWPYSDYPQYPIQITTDKRSYRKLWPLTPKSGSKGGHDTERAIVEITRQLGDSSDAVILLITNTAASIGNSSDKVIGQNAPEYLSVLKRWDRVASPGKSGTSVSLPFDVVPPNGKRIKRTLDAVIVIPKNYSSTQLDHTRPEPPTIKHKEVQEQPRHRHRQWKWALIPIALAIAGVILAGKRMGLAVTGIFQRARPVLHIDNHQFDLLSVGNGSEICHIAGPEYEQQSDRTITVRSEDSLPPEKLASFVRQNRCVRVTGERVRLYSVDDKLYTGELSISSGKEYKLCFEGEYAASPMHPTTRVQFVVHAYLEKQNEKR